MITNIKSLEKYCSEYTKIENYEEAVKSPLKYDLHHRREISESKSKKQLIAENLYYGRPAEELIFIEAREHRILHKAGKHCSGETKRKMSDAKKGEKCYMYGKPKSDETRRKMSDAKKGKPSNWKGKHPSEETRQKISENNRRYWKGKHWHLENGRRIYTD